MKTYILDCDGVLCTEEKTFSRSLAKPLPGALESVNRLKDEGNIIVVFTSRSWSEYEMTEDWLKKHGFKYDRLICGKPIGDVIVDDKALQFNNWKEISKKINKIKK